MNYRMQIKKIQKWHWFLNSPESIVSGISYLFHNPADASGSDKYAWNLHKQGKFIQFIVVINI